MKTPKDAINEIYLSDDRESVLVFSDAYEELGGDEVTLMFVRWWASAMLRLPILLTHLKQSERRSSLQYAEVFLGLHERPTSNLIFYPLCFSVTNPDGRPDSSYLQLRVSNSIEGFESVCSRELLFHNIRTSFFHLAKEAYRSWTTIFRVGVTSQS